MDERAGRRRRLEKVKDRKRTREETSVKKAKEGKIRRNQSTPVLFFFLREADPGARPERGKLPPAN